MWKTLYLYRVRGSAVHAKSNSVVHANTISPIHVENSRHTRGTDLSHTREKTLSHTRGKTCVVTACWMTTCRQRRAVEDFPLRSEACLVLLCAGPTRALIAYVHTLLRWWGRRQAQYLLCIFHPGRQNPSIRVHGKRIVVH